LSFANVKVVSRSVVTYRCADGHEMGVAYMNTDNDQSFAVIRLAGQHVVLVSSIAASGVRYIGAHYIWWTKGDEGTLYDQQKGEDAPPVAADCQALKP
jgi:membrane-bound inhibitor of C-type lysozyme